MHAAALCIATLALAAGLPARAAQTPALKLPDGAQSQVVAADLVINGARSRVVRFHVGLGEREVLDFFRREFGARHVENTVQERRVIASRVGDHFHTVQLERPGPHGVDGTVITTLLGRGPGGSAAGADTEKLLPAESQVLSRMQSDDGGRRALLVTAANGNSLAANRDHLVQALRERGFALVKEDARPVRGRSSISLVLASGAEEAIVTIVDAGRHRSVVIQRAKEHR